MDAISSSAPYWELGDYSVLAKHLRENGVPIRLLKDAGSYHVYTVGGVEVYVYRRIVPLLRYRIPRQCNVVYKWSGKRFIWLVAPHDGQVEPYMNGAAAIFAVNGYIHLVTNDTSVAGFVRLVSTLFSKYVRGMPLTARL